MDSALTLFVGGPRHPIAGIHEQMVAEAPQDPSLRGSFCNAKAFDDDQAKAASQGTVSWRNFLRTCDIAVFLLPLKRSGSKDPTTGKYYTALEVEQAKSGGIPIYLLIEQRNRRKSSLTVFVQNLYQRDLSIYPLKIRSGTEAASKREVISKCKLALQAGVRHWSTFGNDLNSKTHAINNLILQAPKHPDMTLGQKKTLPGSSRATALQTYVTSCYHLRRVLPEQSELPRFLLRGLLYAIKPCLSPNDMDQAILSEGWEQLAQLARPVSRRASTVDAPLELSPALVESLSEWRQLALIRLLRESALAFRYRLDLKVEWSYAQLALKMYRTVRNKIDGNRSLAYDLAIGLIPTAAYSLCTQEFDRIDRNISLLSLLESKWQADAEPGSAQALAVYFASGGEINKAQEYMTKALHKFEGADRKVDNVIHSHIFLACFKTGRDREAQLRHLSSLYTDWRQTSHSFYSELAKRAEQNIGMNWRDLLESFK